MKRILYTLLTILLLFIIYSYSFVPSEMVISKTVFAKANKQAMLRKLMNEAEWRHWWPGDQKIQDGKLIFNYNKVNYQIVKKLYSGFDLSLSKDAFELYSMLSFIPLSTDSVEINWISTVHNSYNPVKRLQQYLKVKSLSRDMDVILNDLRPFIERQENLYGFSINEVYVKDTLLVAVKERSQTYPSVQMIYDLIGKLKKYAKENHAQETNYPMLHINALDDVHFETMVAIPVNKELKGSGGILYKQMVAGKILVTEVKGGPSTVKNAQAQIENFMADYHRTAPAIPFESLITDRTLVTDTNQWRTRVYYPVY